MSVLVVIPFYGTDPLRLRNLKLVLDLYIEELPDWKLWVQGGDSLSEARNRGARSGDSDVIVFNDADTLCPSSQIDAAAYRARLHPGRVACFDIYQRLTERATAQLGRWRDASEAYVEREMYTPPSNGCMAISRRAFEEIGGYDEDFVGWGYEDCEFNNRSAKLFGEPRRVQGEAYHLWHGERRHDDSPIDVDAITVARNLAHYKEKVGC